MSCSESPSKDHSRRRRGRFLESIRAFAGLWKLMRLVAGASYDILPTIGRRAKFRAIEDEDHFAVQLLELAAAGFMSFLKEGKTPTDMAKRFRDMKDLEAEVLDAILEGRYPEVGDVLLATYWLWCSQFIRAECQPPTQDNLG